MNRRDHKCFMHPTNLFGSIPKLHDNGNSMMNYDLIQYIFILYLGYSGLDTSQEE
jgi:hypothetical protein